jgi:predicted tellurium resistance membrane protein TerC
MIGALAEPHTWISLVTLTVLEIVLGIDNLIFVAILANRVPQARRRAARRLGLALALGMRLLLLASLTWLAGLTTPVVVLMRQGFSWRDLVLIAGGLFLLYKSTTEIHHGVEGGGEDEAGADAPVGFGSAIGQIILLDLVFSLDSVITAVGMVDQLWIMATAVIVAAAMMLLASGPLSAFVQRHPTVRMLALAFLMMIALVLLADGFGLHIPKGYVYGAMGFSVLVEGLNQLAARRRAARRR